MSSESESAERESVGARWVPYSTTVIHADAFGEVSRLKDGWRTLNPLGARGFCATR
jgi:hypothetical protein